MLIRADHNPPTTLDELLGPALLAVVDSFDLHTPRVFPGKLPGERRSKRRGRSVEFADYRDYSSGDDIRFIDWRAYARLDRLFIKLFHEEEDVALRLCVDVSPSMLAAGKDTPSKLLVAVRLAAAMGVLGLRKRNRVSVCLFGAGKLQRLPELRGDSGAERLSRFLLHAYADAQDRAAEAAGDTAKDVVTVARESFGAGVFVLLSDLLFPEGCDAALAALGALAAGTASTGYDVVCTQILTPEELNPSIANDARLSGDARFVDAETNEAKDVTITPALAKRYRERIEAHCAHIADTCAKRSLLYNRLTTDADLRRFFAETLREQGALR